MKKLDPQEIINKLPAFKHKIDGQVKFHEVDSFGVLHNVQYFYILEWARTKYFEFLGIPFNNRTFTLENPVMTVRHELNYFKPALLADYYEAYSKISQVGNSSFEFENIIINDKGELLVYAEATLVYLSTEDYRPTRISDEIRGFILLLEGENVFIENQSENN
jgi:YbgC/YbaW family acyl-CoA thioester hydrolase